MAASPAPSAGSPSRLARRLDFGDAVLVGLGAMIGAGVFAAAAPAARAAGPGLLVGLAIAALLALLNATTMARLAALHPESGGAYVYGRRRLGPFPGFLAGWCFITGKLASCAAMAMTFASYAAPAQAQPTALAAVAVLTFVNTRGIQKTARMTRMIVAFVLFVLVVVVGAALLGGGADASRLSGAFSGGVTGTLQAAGILFFAFAGYARLATLGEEVKDPAQTIPRAILVALGITLLVYAMVMTTTVACVGADGLARSTAPLVDAVRSGSFAWTAPLVRAGATLASLGALLSLLAGIGRTAFAMASQADLPQSLAAVHSRFQVPHRAEIVAGLLVAGVVLVADVRGAIGFSSFGVLLYYAIAHAAAWRREPGEGMGPRVVAALGLVGCIGVACTLPGSSVLAGCAIVLVGALVFGGRRVLDRRAR